MKLEMKPVTRLWRRPSLYIVRGPSMEPSLYDGDVALAFTPRRSLERAAIAVIRLPGYGSPEYGIKRIVGLPGERVALEDGLLFIDGARHREPYLRGLPASVGVDAASWTLGAEECFALGDNRAHSVDSRRFGPVPTSAIVAIVATRLWPIRRSAEAAAL